MNLEQNYFTLNVVPRADDRNIIDLVDPDGVAQYTKRRVSANEYKIEMYDTLSEGLLATVTAPSATSKHKTIQLYNPDLVVELKHTGTILFKWGFKWEEHELEWRREECYILRKPDPSVLVASTKEPPGKLQTRVVQLLYYNINRFDVNDRKGLEIVILTALLTLSDLNETYHPPREESTPPINTPSPAVTPAIEPPPVPPKPAPRTGIERVAEMHAVRNATGEGDVNEVEVWEECTVDDYAQYAERLLNDEAMLFISVRSASAAQVPKVLRVVEETKRLRHKSGIAEEEELHQYVIYDTENPAELRKGPRRINLDDPDPKKAKERGQDKGKYKPPTSLTIHLSKIDMPELLPRTNIGSLRRPSESSRHANQPELLSRVHVQEVSDKERRKAEKEKESKKKKTSKEKQKGSSSDGPPSSNKLSKPSSSSSHQSSPSPQSGGYRTPAHMMHPYQPSPSPSQLGNPAIYSALPPPLYPPRPRSVSMVFPTSAANHISPPVLSYSSGYNAMSSPPTPPPAGPPLGNTSHRPTYVATQDTQRPTSFYQSLSGKGPVSALLDLWSKH